MLFVTALAKITVHLKISMTQLIIENIIRQKETVCVNIFFAFVTYSIQPPFSFVQRRSSELFSW